jgi:ATP-dependent DNA ligase
MQRAKEYPLLIGVAKGGKSKIWAAYIEYDPLLNKAIAVMEYGQIDGKKQTSTREYTEGKVKRTALEQCIQETDRKWTDKKEKEGYVEQSTLHVMPEPAVKAKTSKKSSSSSSSSKSPRVSKKSPPKLLLAPSASLAGTRLPLPILPMLAKTYEPSTAKKKRNDIVFPCFVQPKLDGLRCIMYLHDGEIIAQSRAGGHFKSIEQITNSLRPFFKSHPEVVLDGELYTKEIPFEVLAGIIKKKKITADDSVILETITYNVYDIVDLTAPLHARILFLREYFESGQYPRIKFVDTFMANTLADFRTYFREFVDKGGYEGIMLRNISGLYITNYRSDDLQKYKEFMEEEFRIIGFAEGDGHDKGTVKWICETSDGKSFTVRPRGTVAYRKELFRNGSAYVGKLLTVIFQEYTEEGKPRFPVGKAVRDGY